MEETRKEGGAGTAIWLTGLIAAVMFFVSLIAFAAARTDGYSHGTKAVSELGAVGAPNAMAFNLSAMIAPGFLIVILAITLARLPGSRIGPSMLAGSGLLLALAGVCPVDPENMRSATSLGHVIGALGSGLLWAAALSWLGSFLSKQPGLRGWGRLTPWFLLFLLVNIGWQATFQTTGLVLPGWGQRIALVGYFGWVAITGLMLWRRDQAVVGHRQRQNTDG